MPRNYKLTWQAGKDGRTGRWRKKYKGRHHYFNGGRGKTDREAYDAAVESWEKLKRKIDSEAPKPHQAEYELAIAEWDKVLTWSGKHGDDETAKVARAKLHQLREQFLAVKPRSVALEDTFAGRFERSVRYPELDQMIAEVTATAKKVMESAGIGLSDTRDDAGRRILVVPNVDMFAPEPLAIEREVWRDRLEVMQRSAVPVDQRLKAQIKKFVQEKKDAATVGDISANRVYSLELHLTHFRDWRGQETPVLEINGQTLAAYRLELLKKVRSKEWKRITAKDRLVTLKSFVRWLWLCEAIPSLPRNMDGKSKALKISGGKPRIVVFEKGEITQLLTEASGRTRLYVLLMLNTGMTQKDVADLQFSEVDWQAGRIVRKRSKTTDEENVPVVNYLLWPETLDLLKAEKSKGGAGCVLLNANGGPLWFEEVGKDGKYKKLDNVKNAFARLQKKTGITKSLKSLKKTSATLIRDNPTFQGLEGLFLGHAPKSTSDKHYAQAPKALLDAAITWLREEYGLEKLVFAPAPVKRTEKKRKPNAK